MSPRLVIVHERFTELGGSERVVEQLAGLSDNSRVYAPVIDEGLVRHELAGIDVSASGLQRLYRKPGQYAHLLPLLPMAMATADVSDADVVVTSHHAFANRVRVPEGVPLISYTHSPARWMWDRRMLQGETGGSLGEAALRSFALAARSGDRAAANRVDTFIANSQTVADRIRTWWGRHAVVIHPPVDVDFFHPAPVATEDFFLIAGRLVPYKKVAVAVAAASALGRRLVVVGQGRSRAALERLAGPTIEFVGAVSNDELRDLYRRCAALVFPGEEDFGIIPVEAQACGTPVIAARVGGATETVVSGRTGLLVDVRRSDPVAAFAAAMAAFDPCEFDRQTIRTHAEQFSRDRFRRSIGELLSRKVNGWVCREPVGHALRP